MRYAVIEFLKSRFGFETGAMYGHGHFATLEEAEAAAAKARAIMGYRVAVVPLDNASAYLD
ncbi:hypothetical protein [Hymenobacter koreensis]|uniref:Uncharacterized protein n=1 Tax=Hymenobacter koreensis TaxID=1084523 RepID=A0ABP8JJF7_9BACT